MKIPSEIYDLIATFVGDRSLWDDDYVARPSVYPKLQKEDYDTLKSMRFVCKVICNSASRFLFRNITVANNFQLHNLLCLSESRYGFELDPAIYLRDLSMILPISLRNFPILLVFSIEVEAWSERNNFSEASGQLFGDVTQNVLRYTDLAQLEDLSLRLPLTHDFSCLAGSAFMTERSPCRVPLDKLMGGLRHLNVQVCDDSGPNGQRYYSSLPTKSQQRFPNVDYAKGFFQFIEKASNLESLSIYGTHVLDMNVLDISKFRRLRVLQLCRVKLSIQHLSELILQNKHSMRAIELYYVELKTGTWWSLLWSLCSIPNLRHLYVSSCGYDLHGPSAMHGRLLLPPIDDPQDLETLHFPDLDALGHLQRHVMKIREKAGLRQMTEVEYQWGFNPPMDFLADYAPPDTNLGEDVP